MHDLRRAELRRGQMNRCKKTLRCAYAFSMTYEMIAGYLRGFGISMVPAVLTMLGVCGVRIVWLYTAFAAKTQNKIPFIPAVQACGGYVFAKNVRTSGSFCAEKASLVIIARPGIIEVQVRRSCAKTKRENGQT